MSRTSTDTRLIVFAKGPQPGHVKTRLVPRLGAEGAAALHARLVKHTLATAKLAAFTHVELHGAPADDPFLRSCAAVHDVALVDQCAGDLGTRMHHAITNASGSGAVVLIGTDCVPLEPEHLTRAARSLWQGNDAVLVPVEDGGYALIGLARSDPRVFEGIAWGTSSVLHQTRRRLSELGWRWDELDTLWDVDTPADYERLVASGLLDRRAPGGRPRASGNGTLPESL
jgi:rSAM/selenodomain-associated transferase 1